MRAYEILTENILMELIQELRYGSWLIKYYDAIPAGETFQAMGHNPKVKGVFHGKGSSYEEAIQQVKDQIDQQNDADQEKRITKINPKDVTKVEVALNRQFTRDILNDGATAARFIDAGGRPQLQVMNIEYFTQDNVNDWIAEYKMIRMQWVIGSGTTENATEGYSIALGPRRTIESGLEFGGRYYIDEIESDDDVYRTFNLMLDSISQGGGDSKRLNGPGFTVATWTKGGKKLS